MMHDALDTVRRFLNRNLGPLILIAALIGPAWVTGSFESQRLALLCQQARIEWASYQRDHAIAVELGIPVRFSAPQPPEDC